MYTHHKFMRALLSAEETAEAERKETTENPILKVAKPILEKASEGIVKKIRAPRKHTKLSEAGAALELFRNTRKRTAIPKAED